MTRYRFAWSIPPWERVPATTADLVVAVCRLARASREKGLGPAWVHARAVRAFGGRLSAPAAKTLRELIDHLMSGPGLTDEQARAALKEIRAK